MEKRNLATTTKAKCKRGKYSLKNIDGYSRSTNNHNEIGRRECGGWSVDTMSTVYALSSDGFCHLGIHTSCVSMYYLHLLRREKVYI